VPGADLRPQRLGGEQAGVGAATSLDLRPGRRDRWAPVDRVGQERGAQVRQN
jgi:hypothetical protein